MKETMYEKEYLPSRLKYLEIIIMLVNANHEEELEIKNKFKCAIFKIGIKVLLLQFVVFL